ncbi:MAG: mercuric reductase [Verrucomicrobiota bacterium]
MSQESFFELSPQDEFNEQLLANTHPMDWINPKPSGRYNLVVIGGGTAGLVTAAVAAGLGGKVALIERALLGGDCLNVGCVPSKALIRAAKAAAAAQSAGEYGVEVNGVEVDFARVMSRMREIRAGISPHDSAARFRDLGVDVFLGSAEFLDGSTVTVDGTPLKFKKAVIATGGRAVLPTIDGLEVAAPLTNHTLFNLTELPKRLAVIGGGPIGCEMAQAFQRFGSEVTLLQRSERILPNEDPDAADWVSRRLEHEGVNILTDSELTEVVKDGAGKVLSVKTTDGVEQVIVDEILVSAGRRPNTEGLALQKAGVEVNESGVLIDDFFRTANRNIFAAGDVTMERKFTHAADFAARAVVQNALFFGRKRLSNLRIPWCTYTEPELAHVGVGPREAAQKGMKIDSYTREFADVDRGKTDGETEGFVRIHTLQGGDQIVGATIVGSHAGELISEVGVAMAGKVGLGTLASVIHPYPTQAEAIRQIGDAYNKKRFTPTVAKFFSWWLKKSR